MGDNDGNATGGTGTGDTGGAGGGGGTGSDTGGATGGLSQEKVNEIAAREKEQGRRAAIKEITDSLGCTPEEAKARLDKLQETERAQMTEAERKLHEAQEAERKANETLAKAKQTAKAAAIKSALVTEGVPKNRLDRVAQMVEVDGDEPDEKAIQTAVSTLKDDLPELFKPAEANDDGQNNGGGGNGGKPPSGKPAGGKPAPKVDKTAYDEGAELAKSFNPQPANS